MARSDALAALALCALLSGGSASAEGLYLFVIPTEVAGAVAASFDAPLAITAHATDAEGLARRVGAPAPEAGDPRVEILLDAYPQVPSPPNHSDTAATWVVDFDQPAVAALRADAAERFGPRPTAEQLTQFVSDTIDESMGRGFDVASRVAREREGDCTEHAVLLAALARSFGARARVALGLAIVLEGERVQAYGHAWTELREGERWVVADAALRGDGLRVRYLPFGVLADEGPGYGLSIASLTPVWVRRLEVRGGGSNSGSLDALREP